MTNQIITRVIRKCQPDLERRLPVLFVVRRLWSKDVLSWEEKIKIEAGTDDIEKCDKALDILLKKDDKDLNILIDVLKEDTAHQGLVKILEDSKRSVVAELFSIGIPPQPQPQEAAGQGSHQPEDLGHQINMGVNAPTVIQTRLQLIAVASRISDDDQALHQIPMMCDMFLIKATDRYEIDQMGVRREPVIERIKKMLEFHKSRSETPPTLQSISQLLVNSGLPLLAAQVRVMELPPP